MRILRVILLLLVPSCLWAQPLPDTTYRVELTTTASPLFNFFRAPRVPESTSKAFVGYGITIRLLWHPARLLSVGLLSGYCVLAEDDIYTASGLTYHARLAAVPLLLALTMQKNDFEIGMGIGPYWMMTTVEGGTAAAARGSRLELGLTYFGTYMFSLGENVAFGPELRVVYFRYRGILSILPSCSFRFIPLRY